jgi:phage tail tape-measure protein
VTPPRRHQTQTERDVAGLKARRDRESRSVARDQVDELEDAIDESDGTPETWDEIDTGVTVELEEAIRQNPALRVIYAKLKHERKRRASDIMAAMGAKPPAERMSAFEKTLRRLRWIIVAIAIPAGSSTILVGKYLVERSAASERARIELEELQAHDVEYARRVRALEDLATKDAQRIDDFIRSRRLDSDPEPAPRRALNNPTRTP